MANHYHLIVSTPEPDLGEIMRHLSGSVTRIHNRISGREGHLFNGRYKWSLIENPVYYSHALKYVYRNPVKAGITTCVEDYEFSTLHGLLGLKRPMFPIVPAGKGAGDALVPELPADQLPWLNTPFRTDDEEAVRRALRRKVFEFPKNPGRRPSLLEKNRV